MKKLLTLLSICLFICASCDKDDEGAAASVTKQAVIDNYADIVLANYQDAHTTATQLSDKINDFVSDPTAASLQAAKDAWLAARNPYGQSEAFRFYGGPIDDNDGPEGQLNAWPLDESYIDNVEGNVNDGANNVGTNIINSPTQFPTIDKALIASLNEDGGETNVSSGYHAIEFLLWGQDISTGPGGGERPLSDFVVTGDDTTPEARRGQYLKAAVALILDDLQSLIDEWKEGGSYRTFFTSQAELDNSLEKILAGIGKLSKGELAGERMFVAWDVKSKEHEHSCFSDNTHNDILYNAQGIQNVYLGKYVKVDGTTIDGPGIDDLVKAQNTTLNQELTDLLSSSLTKINAMQPPFDQEILAEPGRTRVKDAFDNLRDQGDKIAEVSALFGFTLDPSDI
ncbi:imelysin family protein [Fulvivirgaceae bacterium BMA10]|uniref:Imelysin family protein n=1 Tax=Splendidivirga corallicola TaxID=3051826 RepID=A0ABT8KYX3_9BACT|nr:imelysin family protein [Fulvivirgaceae bacterium BMA10]